MTVLEDEQVSFHQKASRRLLTGDNLNPSDKNKRFSLKLKRRHSTEHEVVPTKKQLFEDMLNGYRGSNDNYRSSGDAVLECPVATLSNMGNTCFLNSVIYTLRFAPTFLHNLHHLIGDLALIDARYSHNKAKSSSLGRNITSSSGPSSRSTSSKDLLSLGSSNDVIPKLKVQIVTEKLHELFVMMHNFEVKELSDTYQPSALLQAIREANYIFEGNHQQDAHELLVYLLDNIRETCDLLAQHIQHNPEILYEAESSNLSSSSSKFFNVRRSWKKPNKKKDKNAKDVQNEDRSEEGNAYAEDAIAGDPIDISRRKIGYNFVAEDFEGITLRRTKCLECESVTERKEPFYDIPVPINTNENFDASPSEIYRKACVTYEKLCDSNKYLCEKCKRYNEASREVSFEKLPNIMVLQLKRFTTSVAGIQKVNSYLPTPLELECFCERCCQMEDGPALHRYNLCCVIMHLGGTMASGHYISYVRLTDHSEDYLGCTRDAPKGSLSASSSEKSLNILKYIKNRTLSSTIIDTKNGLIPSKSQNSFCRSIDCCGIKLNRNVFENVINNCTKKALEKWQIQDDLWLECDDENVRLITRREFEDVLSFKPNSTSTPYLLFYSKVTDRILDD
ncbi:ubiquitin carboxyl-terminal hydrolase 1 [Agrilus planipennis]|uniref:Ubiquitin carboxyl-terminal hydrolase 1 n=1 Tax=Agrilus planipennis TaxID=224129 RepID=A0A1W4XQY7_AGRPL|nr:ubiquitin carboxyl-terminal hydrolase 1 [Agrilus planipennis]